MMGNDMDARSKSLMELMSAMGRDEVRRIPGVTIRIEVDDDRIKEEISPEGAEEDRDDEDVTPFQKLIMDKKREARKA